MKKLSGGMVKDGARVDQAEGTMRDALNVNLNIEKGSILNEYGTSEYAGNENFSVLGSVTLDDDRIVMCGQDILLNNFIPTFTDQIRIITPKTNQVVILYEDNNLNFHASHPIVCDFRKNQANEVLVYFTDGYTKKSIDEGSEFEYISESNPPRTINITKQLQFRSSGGLVTDIYNSTNSHHKLQLIPRVGKHSDILSAEIVSGGGVITGAYYLALAYADQSGLETNYFVVSNPVYIAPGNENMLPTNVFIGAQGGTPTNKSIKWVIDVPLTEYEFLQPAIIQQIDEVRTVYKLGKVLVGYNGGKGIVHYSGVEDVQILAPEDVIVDDVNYISAGTLSQVDNRLYLGNIRTNKDIGFQPFANNINITAVTETVANFNPRVYDTYILNHGYAMLFQTSENFIGQQYKKKYTQTPGAGWVDNNEILFKSYYEILSGIMKDSTDNFASLKGYRNPKYSFKKKSYKRGEVYAFYMSFILNDGTETYAYHVPGRGPETFNQVSQTAYEPIVWIKYTFMAADPVAPNILIPYEIVFALLPNATANSTNWASDGYSEGIYRPDDFGAWDNGTDNSYVISFNAGGEDLPGSINIADPAGPLPLGYIALNGASGGVFGSNFNTTDDTTNYIQTWLENHGPTLEGDMEWHSLASTETLELEASLLESEYSLTLETMFEDSLMRDFSNENNRGVHGFRPEEMLNQDENLQVYQVVDTHTKVDKTTGFWKNQNETYPNTRDFLNGIVNTDGTVSMDPENNIIGQNVRHHKMPSNLSDDFSYVDRQTGTQNNYAENAIGSNLSPLNTGDHLQSKGTLITNEDVKFLGIKLEGIKIPKYILSQVQGYKIYYAKRKPEDKTILGQSIAVPGQVRYASSPEQSKAVASKGPYYKAFYLYGGLDHSSNSSIDTYGTWKQEEHQRYYSHPVFTFHDFNMLRKQNTLSGATHVQCQYGVIFRPYQGGPGAFVDPVPYHTLYDTVADSGYTDYNDVSRKLQQSSTFPSLGWVSADMGNTVDFYYVDPLHTGVSEAGDNRILDISDDVVVDLEDTGSRSNSKRWEDDLTQPSHTDSYEQEVLREAKAAKVRAWFTSVMVGTTYLSPSAVLNGFSNIKGGDYKGHVGAPSTTLNRFYQEDIDDNALVLAVEPNGATYLPGLSLFESKDVTSFKGSSYLYNQAGESCAVFSLISGLPSLRGHSPNLINSADGTRYGLTRWGEGNRWLYPDAAIDGVPKSYQLYGVGYGTDAYNANGYSPTSFRGLNYALEAGDPFVGLPMAWLLNICATKTDVFNPFEAQELVWTGYYHPLNSTNIDTGAASDYGGSPSNYYYGANSKDIFGGDTYITKYSFRSTSQSYGHAYWRASKDRRDAVANKVNAESRDYFNTILAQGEATGRFQGDIPQNIDPRKYFYGSTDGSPIWNHDEQSADSESTAEDTYTTKTQGLTVLKDTSNWVKGNVNPVSTIFTFMVESDDLIEFRHVNDSIKGVQTEFFDYNIAASTLFKPPTDDLTKGDNLLYSNHYSALQDIKVASPLPVYSDLAKAQTFPRRIVRSDIDSGSLADGYRKFRALEYKDIASNRGEIQSLFNYRGLLYIHTDRALFVTKGKEELQLSQITAFIGTGDIFQQEPTEVQESTLGYGGTTSRHCHTTTQYGHFFLNYKDRKFYNLGGKGVEDITRGMETWIRENMPFAVEQYGIDLSSQAAQDNGFFIDSPMGQNVPLGFTMGYDPMFDRILITKHEPIPTKKFVEDFLAGNISISGGIPYAVTGVHGANCIGSPDDPVFSEEGGDVSKNRGGAVYCGPIWFGNPFYFTQGGWTISYYPSNKVWGSMHSYLPNFYSNTSEYLISFADNKSWEHTNKENPGRFYGEVYNFEIEFIDNTEKGTSKLFSNIYYWAESTLADSIYYTESSKIYNTVFTEFYVYNSTQISGLPTAINYLSNARLVDRVWNINSFRDMSKSEVITGGGVITGVENVAGFITSSVTTHSQDTPMFTSEGVVNPLYVDTLKDWYNRRKLVDHFLGVRLINDNSTRNLVHLYAVGTKFRKSNR
jgi:hypothetical protein